MTHVSKISTEPKKKKRTLVRTGQFSRKLFTEAEIKENTKRYLLEWRSARPGWNKAANKRYSKKMKDRKLREQLGIPEMDVLEAAALASKEVK